MTMENFGQKPLTHSDVAEPKTRDAGLALLLRRAARMAWHKILPADMERKIVRSGLRYKVNRKEGAHRMMIRRGYLESEQVVFLFNEARNRAAEVFLDIGANFGYYSLLAAKLGGFSGIHAVEPHPQTYERLLWHIRANGFDGAITPHNVAASSAARKMRMPAAGTMDDSCFDVLPVGENDSDGDGGGTLIFRELSGKSVAVKASETLPVAAAPLDSLFDFRGRSIAVKIDVEGHELEALKGAENLFAHNRVLAQVENWPEKTAVLNEFMARGFRLIYHTGYDFYFVKEPD